MPCVKCTPVFQPSKTRLGRWHYTIEDKLSAFRTFVSVNGDSQAHVVECQAGPKGWALTFTKPSQMCIDCGRDQNMEFIRGNIHVSTRPIHG